MSSYPIRADSLIAHDSQKDIPDPANRSSLNQPERKQTLPQDTVTLRSTQANLASPNDSLPAARSDQEKNSSDRGYLKSGSSKR